MQDNAQITITELKLLSILLDKLIDQADMDNMELLEAAKIVQSVIN